MELLKVKDLSKILQVKPLTIRRYMDNGTLKGVKIGRFWYVKKSDLELFFSEQTENKG